MIEKQKLASISKACGRTAVARDTRSRFGGQVASKHGGRSFPFSRASNLAESISIIVRFCPYYCSPYLETIVVSGKISFTFGDKLK